MVKAIIDMETGEILREIKKGDTLRTGKQNEFVRKYLADINITDELLLNPTKDFIKSLYVKMRATGRINKYGFIWMDGSWFNPNWYELCAKSGVLAVELNKIAMRVSARNFIKSNTDFVEVKTWLELFEVLGVKSTRKQAQLKKIFSESDFIRIAPRPNKKKVLVVNPNWIRKGTWVSDFSLSVFKDCTLYKIDIENAVLLFLNGLIDKEDLIRRDEKIKSTIT